MNFIHLLAGKNRALYLSTLAALTLFVAGCARNDNQDETNKTDKKTASVEKKDKKSAPLVFEKPYNANESNLAGAFLSARIAQENGDFAGQSAHASRVFELDSKDTFVKDLGVRAALINDDYDSALKLSKEIEKNANGESALMNAPAVLTLMTEAFEKEDYIRARLLSERYAKENFNILVYNMIAQSALFASNSKISEKPEGYRTLNAFALFRFFEMYHKGLQEKITGKDNKAAEKHLTDAIKLSESDPLAARAVLTLADLYVKTDRKKDAIRILEKALEVKPVPVLKNALTELKEKGSFSEKIVSDKKSLLAETLFNIGVVYAREGEGETSLTFLNLADRLAPETPAILSTKAEIYQSLKDHARAFTYFQKLMNSEPESYRRQATLEIAYSYNQMEKFDEAEKVLQTAIEKEPKFYRYPFILGDFYRMRERYSDAVTQYDQALSLLPASQKKSSWKLYYARGVSYERMKNWEKAEADLIRALDLAPNNPEVINYLAYSWLEQEEENKYDEALILLEKAVEAAPENAHIIDSLGWAYYKKGDYEKAVEFLERALELTPGDPVVNDHLGDAYFKANRKREALFQWRHAADFKPDKELAAEIEKKIENESIVITTK